MCRIEPSDHADPLNRGTLTDAERVKREHLLGSPRELVPLGLACVASLPLPATQGDERPRTARASGRSDPTPGRRLAGQD